MPARLDKIIVIARSVRTLTSPIGTCMFEVWEGNLLLAIASTKEEAGALRDTSRHLRG